jgi:fructose-1,6-bisphosphatase
LSEILSGSWITDACCTELITHAAPSRLMATVYDLRDKLFPTIDPADPYRLTAEELSCLAVLKHSFLNSQKLQEQIRFYGRPRFDVSATR